MIPSRPIRFIPSRVADVRDVHGVRILKLRDPDGWELPPASPGAHIDLYLENGLTRAYSLCGDPALGTEYCLVIKKDNQGRGGSIYIHEELRIGDTIAVSLPRNTFPLLSADHDHIFIAGGIGVTPFLAMMHHLERLHARYTLHLYYRDVVPVEDLLQGLGTSGKIMLHDRARDRSRIQDALPGPAAHVQAFFCGPLAMVADFDEGTKFWNPENVHKEYFVPPACTPSENAYALVLRKAGTTVPVAAGETALEALHKAGINVPHSCGGGICRGCMVPWLEGEPEHQDLCLSEDERRRYFTPCVSSCKGEALVLDI